MAIARPLVPSRLAPSAVIGHSSTHAPRSKIAGYIALTKPRIIELLLITTIPTMVMAERGLPAVHLMIATLVGGAFAAGGANAINMYVDRDIDRLMPRTQHRPLVTGIVEPRSALIFAISLEVIAFALLTVVVNLLSAVLALGACLFYVFVYTLWLKRTSTQNIVIGGAAGAVPVLIGWSAVTNSMSWSAIVLFGVIFLWTPPHFWALAIRYSEDYRAADVPMLPVVTSYAYTAKRMLAYSAAVVLASLVLIPVGHLGWVYGITASLLGAGFMALGVDVLRVPTAKRAMRLFGFSITYVTLLFGAIAVDTFVVHGW
ncbi:MAG: heme o synthase [Acidimicrobiia bacterium]